MKINKTLRQFIIGAALLTAGPIGLSVPVKNPVLDKFVDAVSVLTMLAGVPVIGITLAQEKDKLIQKMQNK